MIGKKKRMKKMTNKSFWIGTRAAPHLACNHSNGSSSVASGCFQAAELKEDRASAKGTIVLTKPPPGLVGWGGVLGGGGQDRWEGL